MILNALMVTKQFLIASIFSDIPLVFLSAQKTNVCAKSEGLHERADTIRRAKRAIT